MSGRIVGIRREDKNVWERRTPLTPEAVRHLTARGIHFRIQPSPNRIFPDEAYVQAGAILSEDLSSCDVVFGVKEMPVNFFQRGKTYVFFAHVIKGQSYNMPMLKRLMERECTLIDYERIVDDRGKRLVFFGVHAGIAGMIDSFWALGRRLEAEGIETPFARIRQAKDYPSLHEARRSIRGVANLLFEQGLPAVLRPFVVGFLGYGHTSEGAQSIFDLFPHVTLEPDELFGLKSDASVSERILYKVIFHKPHMYRHRKGHPFKLDTFNQHPDEYESGLEPYLPHLTMLMNCIYWEPRFPKLLTRDMLIELYRDRPRLRVIGDVTCDIRGALDCTVRATTPGNPVYVYLPDRDEGVDGVDGHGPVVLAVDNLPCEISREASEYFSQVLLPFVPEIVNCEYDQPFDRLPLSLPIRRAVIVHRGNLTPDYEYLRKFL